jgi:hypothetical protein
VATTRRIDSPSRFAQSILSAIQTLPATETREGGLENDGGGRYLAK